MVSLYCLRLKSFISRKTIYIFYPQLYEITLYSVRDDSESVTKHPRTGGAEADDNADDHKEDSQDDNADDHEEDNQDDNADDDEKDCQDDNAADHEEDSQDDNTHHEQEDNHQPTYEDLSDNDIP